MKTHFRLALGVVATVLSASSATFHVDERAAAGGDGSPVRPWRTAHDAVDGVRAARKAGAVKPGEAVTVAFAPGDYFVGSGLRLTAADSGTAEAPVVWRTAGAGCARLTAGVRVPPERFRKVDDPAVLARLRDEARGKVYVGDISSLAPAQMPHIRRV